MMLASLVVSLLLLMVEESTESTPIRDYLEGASRVLDLYGVTLTSGLLFETTDTSEEDCTLRCLSHKHCVTFTFSKETPLCRGFMKLPESVNTTLSHSDTQTWTMLNREEPSCPPNSTYDLIVPGVCLKLYPNPLSWVAAKNQCLADGAQMFKMDTLQRRDILAGYLTDIGASKTELWLDATDQGSEGDWYWADGQPLPDDNPLWASGQPNNENGNEHCLKITISLMLDDVVCNIQKEAFVCEILVN